MGSDVAKPFNQEHADEILEEIACTSKSLHAILGQKKEYPKITTFFKWLNTNELFAKDYARAKEIQAHVIAEQTIEIADDSTNDVLGVDDYGNKIENKEFVNRSRLRVDTRKWMAAHLLPKKFGDKVDITSDGEKLNTVVRVGFKNDDDEE